MRLFYRDGDGCVGDDDEKGLRRLPASTRKSSIGWREAAAVFFLV